MNSINGYYFEEISIGMTAEFSKTVTEAEINAFAQLSEDFNPVHLDEAYAKTTMFKGRIAHGMLSAAFISTALGTRLPGPGCVYVNQSLKFKAPVRIGDTVVTRVEVLGLVPEKKFVTLKTTCLVNEKVVLEGEATMMVAAREVSK